MNSDNLLNTEQIDLSGNIEINLYRDRFIGRAFIKRLTSLADLSFDDLSRDTNYIIELIYEYDLNDGNGFIE